MRKCLEQYSCGRCRRYANADEELNAITWGLFMSLTHFCAYISALEKIFSVNVEVVQMLEKNCLKYVTMCRLPDHAKNVLKFIF